MKKKHNDLKDAERSHVSNVKKRTWKKSWQEYYIMKDSVTDIRTLYEDASSHR